MRDGGPSVKRGDQTSDRPGQSSIAPIEHRYLIVYFG
jgi:hypothetical protein